MDNDNISDIQNTEFDLTLTQYFNLVEFVKSLCSNFDIEYFSLFNSENISIFLEKLSHFFEEKSSLYSKYLLLVKDIYNENQDNSKDDFELILKLLFYPGQCFEINKDFDISIYDDRIDLYKKRVFDESELRHQECSKSRLDWYDPNWWRIFVLKHLREANISQEWLMNNPINIIVQEWIALQKSYELRASIDYDDKVNREIESEVNKPISANVDGKEIQIQPRNIRFQKQQMRKKYYKPGN